MGKFRVLSNVLDHNDIRYLRWRRSLSKRGPSWSKGYTKETNSGLKKMSETFKAKGIDNFKQWRANQIKLGKIIPNPPELSHSAELAELYGLAIGDGHIQIFPRTERLTITLDAKYPYLIERTAGLLFKVFKKRVVKAKAKETNAVQVYIYQKNIAKRMGFPSGNRSQVKKHIPDWIWADNSYLLACVKGLFEAEGSLSIHLPSCTYNFQFSNVNQYLLSEMEIALEMLGLHPEVRPKAVRLRKRHEVQYLEKLIDYHK